MSVKHVKGKEVLLPRGPMVVFSIFSDLSRFTLGLPDEFKDKVTGDADNIVINSHGVTVGITVEERIPFSKVILKDDGQAPFPFKIFFFMEAMGVDQTLFHIELETEMNVMMSMMIGNKLQEMVDSMTDQLLKALSSFSGEMPDPMTVMESLKKTDSKNYS